MHNLQLYIMWIGLSQQSIQIFLRPDPHPSTQKFNDLNSMSLDADYQSLVNNMQRHTRCNAAYCLQRKNGQEATCRFGYPIECALTTTTAFVGKLKLH